MKVALVVNPLSGSHFSRKRVEGLKSELKSRFSVTEYVVSDELETNKIGEMVRDFYELVVVCGGDGTVSSIAQSLINSQTSLLVFPIGSGNDFATHLNMTNDVSIVIQNIQRLRKVQINTIEVNNGAYYVLTIICFAFEAKVNRIASALPRFIGSMKYTVAALIAVLGRTFETIKLSGTGINEEGSYSLAILANSSSFGGGMQVSNKANVFAQELYLILVKKVSRFKLVYLFILLLLGKHYDRKEFRQIEVQDLQIEGIEIPIRSQADGESLFEGNVSVRILQDSLLVIDCR